MTWTWKCGTSWYAASPSMTRMLIPLAPSVCRAIAASLRATRKVRIADVSLMSVISTACSRGTTSMCPWVMGWMSMKATTVSSWYTQLAGEVPWTMSQKTHWSLTALELSRRNRLFSLRTRFHRSRFRNPIRLRRGLTLEWLGPVRRHRRLAVRDRLARVGRPLSAPPPACPAVAPARPGEALDLGADADALAGRDDRAHPRDQSLLLAVLEQRAEQLGRAADDRLRVADDDQQLLGARDGDVDPVGVVQEADRGAVVGADEGKDDRIRLPALEGVHRLDVVRRHDALQRTLQAIDLRVVHRDHRQLRLAHPAANDRGDVLAQRDLELVRDRPLRVAVLVLSARVDPDQLAVERPRQRHARVRCLVDELALVEEVGDDPADGFAHPVLARQHDLRAGRHLVPDPAVVAVVAHELVERLRDGEGGRRLLHDRGQLVEVA